MKKHIAVIPGDGIGPEIVREAKKVLDRVGEVYGHEFTYTEVLMGGCSIDVHGVPLTDEALETCKASDSVLLGAVGGNVGQSNWYKLAPNLRPEAGLLAIRKGLGLYANIRPAVLFEELKGACPLKDEISKDGFDFVVMRELTGGLYFGERKTVEESGVRKAIDTLTYEDLFRTYTNASESKDLFNYFYSKLALDSNAYNNRSQQLIDDIFTRLKEEDITIKYYESRYADLWK